MLRSHHVALVTVLLAAGSARAEMISYMHSQPPVMTNFDIPVLFPQFNENDSFGDGTNIPGVLLSVILEGDWALTASLMLQNNTDNPIMVEGQVDSAVSVRKADNTVLTGGTMMISTGPVTVPANQTITVGPLMDTTLTTVTLTNPADLMPFIGTGILPLRLVANASLGLSGGGGDVVAQMLSLVGTDVTLTYLFVPEPQAIALLAGGVLFSGLRRRRRFGGV